MTTLRTFGFVPASTGKQNAAVAIRMESTRWRCTLAWFDRDLVRSDSSASTDVISLSLIRPSGLPDQITLLFDLLGATKTAASGRSRPQNKPQNRPDSLLAHADEVIE